MSKNTIICEERWSYVVFLQGDNAYLTFLTGGVVEVDHSVQLSESELLSVKANLTCASDLVRRLSSNQEELSARELPSPIWPSKT